MRMSRALILTAPAGRATLTQELTEAAAATLPAAQNLATRWLGTGEAWDASYDAQANAVRTPVLARAAAAVGAAPVDVNLIDVLIDAGGAQSRRKRLLIADMESTIIEQEMLDELADFVGLRARIADITERAMRGELDFEAAIKERVGLLAGLDARVLDEVADRITLMPGAEALVRTMKMNCAYCALVSGGFTVFTARVAARLGFDEHQANEFEIAGGKLTGRVREPILGRQAKLAALQRLMRQLGLERSTTLAVGDGSNDLAMLEAAGLGVAFRAKPMVREAASAFDTGAVITHGDLTALLYLQGYGRDQFAV